MKTDINLANAILAHGVGAQSLSRSCDKVGFYHLDPEMYDQGLCAELFVRDWGVAGALIDQVRNGPDTTVAVVKWVSLMRDIRRVPVNENLPRAICEIITK